MSFIVYQKDPRNGRTYAYSATSKWDPDKRRAVQTRIYLGRYDEETNQIVPKKVKKHPDELPRPAEQITSPVVSDRNDSTVPFEAKISSVEKQLNLLDDKLSYVIQKVDRLDLLFKTVFRDVNEMIDR